MQIVSPKRTGCANNTGCSSRVSDPIGRSQWVGYALVGVYVAAEKNKGNLMGTVAAGRPLSQSTTNDLFWHQRNEHKGRPASASAIGVPLG